MDRVFARSQQSEYAIEAAIARYSQRCDRNKAERGQPNDVR
jgi:hypothetical protein